MLYANYAREKLHNLTLVKEARGYPCVLLKSKGVNLKDYKIYGNSELGLLPQEYQRVEYIENSYRQCIDTGVIPTNNTSIEITYQALMYETNSQYIAGSREGTSGTINYAVNGAGGRTDWDIRFASSAIFSNVTRTGDVYKSTISLTEGNGNWNLTNLDTSESYDFPIVDKSINATTNLFLFGYNTINIHSNLRIFECKIQEGTKLIRYFIPCYKKSNGVIGMYDLVNDVFYVNATDNINPFTKGADILPTPEAPVEIESVGDKTKNIYDYTKALGELDEVSTNGITFKIAEGGILVNGTATGSANSGRKYNLKPYLEAGKTYTASSIGTGVAPIFYSIENGTANWNRTKTITGNEDTIALYLQVAQGTTIDNLLVKVQLEEGKVVTEYEPFGYKIPVTIGGTNILPYPYVDTTKTTKGITFTDNGDGSISIKGTATSDAYFILQNNVDFGDNNINSISSNYATNNEYTASKRLFFNASNKLLSINIIKDTTLDETIYPMLVEGVYTELTVPDYEPYVEPITTKIFLDEPLRKIGNYADYIDFKNKKVVRKIKETELTGSEVWGLPSYVLDGYSSYRIVNFFEKTPAENFLCNYFPTMPEKIYYDYVQNIVTSFPGTAQLIINVSNDIADSNSQTSSTNWKNWLSSQKNNGTPVKMYHIINSVEETIELPTIPTYKGRTIIETNTNVAPSDIWVKYISK